MGAEDGENANFEKVVGTTGGGDRLALIFNANRFRLVRSQELTHINQGNHRAPLVAELQEISSNRNPRRLSALLADARPIVWTSDQLLAVQAMQLLIRLDGELL